MPQPPSGVLERLRPTGDPVADPAAQVVVGGARFTVLTERLLRLEWSPDATFEDRATFAFPTRRGPVPRFDVREEDGTTVVDTGALVLRHTPDGAPLNAANLSIELAGDLRATWTPGTVDRHNLGGARRTVDRARGGAMLDPGLVSRSGWAVVDDAGGFAFGADGWPEPRRDDGAQDRYFFGHGHDYAGAVAEYTRFGGAVPLVPRWVLGTWWSRYWPYSEADVRELVAGFRERELPLDVFVLDMDWHTPMGWTGYSWNRELFPDPAAFIAWLHGEGLRTTLNLHPAAGVQPFEDAYPEFAAAVGVTDGEGVPFRIADRDFVRAYLELLHHPREAEGVDFWWIDWQQGTSTEIRGLDPLPWLNHLHFTDLARHRERRPLIFSRWGGLGSHRHPVGFSGDSFSRWEALRFQPRYTAAGANVAYAWWSHDIGGHVGAADPELYVRWLQFGALSPVLRLHSTNHPDNERLPWAFGDEVLDAARRAYHLRSELLPYLYTAARVTSETGVAFVRPVAWAAPEAEGAYLARDQFLLGDAILAAPVVRPADPATGLAPVDVWLPEGEWLERGSGETYTGPRWVRLAARLTDVPQFLRPGAILPLAEVAASTSAQPHDHLVLEVHAGADGSARVYEDDGTSRDHEDGAFAWTAVTVSAPDPARAEVVVGAADGAYDPGPRRITLRLPFTHAPAHVTVDGAPHDGWRHQDGTTVVELPARARGDATTVAVAADGPLVARRPGGAADAPFVQVIEHRAPEEAAATLGRVVVAAAADGSPAEAWAVWQREAGGTSDTVETEPQAITGDALVLDAPWAWDGTGAPARWRVDVTVRHGGAEAHETHEAGVLCPTFADWRVAVDDGDWRTVAPAAGDIDFPELTAPAVLRLRAVDPERRGEGAATARCEVTVQVPAEREVAFAYAAAGAVAVEVDGAPLEADVTGTEAMPFYTLEVRERRTAPVRLGAGAHRVVFAVGKTAEMASYDWYLWAGAVDPATGEPLLDGTRAVPA